jgi:hypothetical protein
MFLVSICRQGILVPAVELRHLRYFEAYVNCDARHDQVLATRLLDRGYELRIIPRADDSRSIDHRHIREQDSGFELDMNTRLPL